MKEKSFCDIFKELRSDEKLSQEKMAEKLDVSPALISKWERDESTPNPEMLEYISNYFNVSVDYLIGKSQFKNLESDFSELDKVLFSKAKDLTDDDKRFIIDLMQKINKEIDEEQNK